MTTASQQPIASEAAQIARFDWYNAEMTRYRDLQFTITNFFAAFYVALLYIILDGQKLAILQDYRIVATVAILAHLAIGLWQFRFILMRLHDLRDKQSSVRLALGIAEAEDLRTTPKEHRFQGRAWLFPWSLIVIIAALAAMTLYLLWW